MSVTSKELLEAKTYENKFFRIRRHTSCSSKHDYTLACSCVAYEAMIMFITNVSVSKGELYLVVEYISDNLKIEYWQADIKGMKYYLDLII